MGARFWERDGFWMVMIIVILIVGISDPPVWCWLIEQWEVVIIIALILLSGGLLIYSLYLDSKIADLKVQIESKQAQLTYLENERERERNRKSS